MISSGNTCRLAITAVHHPLLFRARQYIDQAANQRLMKVSETVTEGCYHMLNRVNIVRESIIDGLYDY
jgi:hypothetical protein